MGRGKGRNHEGACYSGRRGNGRGPARENRPVSPSGLTGDGIDGEQAAAASLVTGNDCRSRDCGGAPVTEAEIDGHSFGRRGAQRPDGCRIDLGESGEQRNGSKDDESGGEQHWIEEHND
jgi:hypothetical protein